MQYASRGTSLSVAESRDWELKLHNLMPSCASAWPGPTAIEVAGRGARSLHVCSFSPRLGADRVSGHWPPATRSAASTESTMSPHSGRWSPATRSAASTESTTRHPGAGPRLPTERGLPRSPHQPFRTLAPGNPQRGIDRVHHTSPGRWPKATRRAGSAKVTTPTLQDAGPRQPAARHQPSPPHVTRALAQGYPPSGVRQGHHTNPSGRWPPATRSAASTESTTRHPGAGPRLPAERSPPRSPHQPCLGAGRRRPAKGPPKSPHHPLALGELPCGVGRGHHLKRSYQPPRFPSFSGAVLALGFSIMFFVRSSGSKPAVAPSFEACCMLARSRRQS